jgi:hypothetical protein
MAAVTRPHDDPLGFPTPAVAAAKLVAFLVALPILVLGLPVLAAVAIYVLVA